MDRETYEKANDLREKLKSLIRVCEEFDKPVDDNLRVAIRPHFLNGDALELEPDEVRRIAYVWFRNEVKRLEKQIELL